jgi:hypothetical protein
VIRDATGLKARQEIDIVFADGRIEIELPPVRVHIEKRGRVAVIVSDQEMPELTEDIVRETLESVRR